MTTPSPKPRRIVRRAVMALVAVVLLAVVAVAVAPRISARAAAAHQRGITRELAQWASEYCMLRDDSEALRAVDMLEYVPSYYVPQEGYRSDQMTEAALERQRAATIAAIVDGLRDFSGEDFGTDVTAWRDWLIRRAEN